MNNEIKINTIGQLLDFVETEEKAKELIDYITNLQEELEEEKRIEQEDFKTIQNLEEENSKLSEWLVEKQQRIEGLEAENETLRSDFKNQVGYTNKIAEENERLYIELEDKAYEQLKEQCFNYKSRIDKAIEYITSYEAISTIQGLDKIEQNKKLDERTINVMVERYLKVHHNLLNILGDKDE